MAVHIFRCEATYYWRNRTPRALANFLGRPHVFMSLRTTSPVTARRLATQLDAILEDAAMLAENTDLHLSRSQIETMLGAVVQRHLTMLRKNDMVPTKHYVLREMIESVKAAPTAMNMVWPRAGFCSDG